MRGPPTHPGSGCTSITGDRRELPCATNSLWQARSGCGHRWWPARSQAVIAGLIVGSAEYLSARRRDSMGFFALTDAGRISVISRSRLSTPPPNVACSPSCPGFAIRHAWRRYDRLGSRCWRCRVRRRRRGGDPVARLRRRLDVFVATRDERHVLTTARPPMRSRSPTWSGPAYATMRNSRPPVSDRARADRRTGLRRADNAARTPGADYSSARRGGRGSNRDSANGCGEK
jgi:hypothetical protein